MRRSGSLKSFSTCVKVTVYVGVNGNATSLEQARKDAIEAARACFGKVKSPSNTTLQFFAPDRFQISSNNRVDEVDEKENAN